MGCLGYTSIGSHRAKVGIPGGQVLPSAQNTHIVPGLERVITIPLLYYYTSTVLLYLYCIAILLLYYYNLSKECCGTPAMMLEGYNDVDCRRHGGHGLHTVSRLEVLWHQEEAGRRRRITSVQPDEADSTEDE
jgi:hypothetical protein